MGLQCGQDLQLFMGPQIGAAAAGIHLICFANCRRAMAQRHELRDRWSPDDWLPALRKRKNKAHSIIRVDIKCKPGTLVISG